MAWLGIGIWGRCVGSCWAKGFVVSTSFAAVGSVWVAPHTQQGRRGSSRPRVSIYRRVTERDAGHAEQHGRQQAKSRGQTLTNASNTRHTHTRQALDTPTQVSQGDRPTGNRGQKKMLKKHGRKSPSAGNKTKGCQDTGWGSGLHVLLPRCPGSPHASVRALAHTI
jgi:hypothetical protein